MKKIAILVLLLTGCAAQQVPNSDINFVSKSWNARLKLPKDDAIEGFHAVVAPDGSVDITIKSLNAKMNPEVITTSGASTEQVIRATGDVVTKTAETIIKATGKVVIPVP